MEDQVLHPPVPILRISDSFWYVDTLSAGGLGDFDALSMQRHRTSQCIAWPCSQSFQGFPGGVSERQIWQPLTG